MSMPYEPYCAVANVAPPPLNDSSVVSGSGPSAAPDSLMPGWMSEMTMMDWVVVALVALAALILIYVVVRVLRRRAQLRSMVNTMREDLLLRRELAAMAAGKDLKAQQREQYLRTENIRMDLAAAKHTMEERGLSPSNTGSWLLLGEPGSGKSRLMEFGGIRYPAGINDFSLASEPTSTFNMWLADKGMVWDIGGRLFLSRWGGRQDHEWQTFLAGYKKIFKNNLIRGVVLTIPADALLLDPAELRDRKVSLIAEEMRALSRTCGVYCPVWVVITKCDQLDGFSEFFSLLHEKDAEKPLGWQNPSPEQPFDPSVADRGFDELLEHLRTLRASFALNESVWEKCAASGGRRDDTAIPVYLLPEAFARMKENLKRYLAGIFTHVESKRNARGLFPFMGVWFTAALDKPVTTMERVMFHKDGNRLSPVVLPNSGEDISPVPAEQPGGDAVADLVSVREKILSLASPRHYFTAHLLQHLVLGSGNRSDYTDAAARRMRRPYWVGAASLLALALPLVLWSALHREDLKRLADRHVEFWSKTHQLFVGGAIHHAPLIAAEKDRQISLTDVPVPGTQVSRREYLYNLDNMSTLSTDLPMFWRAASWVTDGEASSILLEKHKKFIDKAAVVCMLVQPVVDSARAVLTYRAEHYSAGHHPWTEDDTKSLAALMRITNYGIHLMNGQRMLDDIVYADMVNLGSSPSQEAAIKSLWSASTAGNKTIMEMSILNGYLKPVSMEAAQAITSGVALYTEALNTMEIYPQFNYLAMRRFLERLSRMQKLQADMKRREAMFRDAVRDEDPERMHACRDEWKGIYEEALKLQQSLLEDERYLGIASQNSLRECVEKMHARMHAEMERDIHLFDDLGKYLGDSENAVFLRNQVIALHKAISDKIPRIAQECDSLPEDVCALWDRRKEDDAAGLRPWQRFMAYAKSLHGVLYYPLPAGEPGESFHRRIARVKDVKKRYDEAVSALTQQGDSELGASCWEQNWLILTNRAILNWFRIVPLSNTEVIPEEQLPKTPRKLPAIPYTRAGKYTLNPHYDPDTVNSRITDLNELSAFVHDHLAAGKSRDDEQISQMVDLLDETCRHFLLDYVMYWTDEIPAHYKIQGIRTWAQFVESGDVFFTADVSGMLYEINDLMYRALSIPCLQDKELFPDVPARLEEINRAQKGLTSEARRSFLHSADFISRLDTSPSKAWQTLMRMPVEELFKQFWGSWYADESDATFLWWNDYLSNGMRLLKKEAADELSDSVRGCLPLASMFPLCNTPMRRPEEILSSYDLENLQERLEGLSGLSDAKQEEEIAKQAGLRNIPEESAALRLPMPRQRQKAWAKVSDVVQLLANPELPLTAAILLPPAEVRSASVSGEDGKSRLLPVGRRYPYFRVMRDGEALSSLVNLNRDNKEDIALTSGPIPAEAGNLQFQFFRRAGDSSPDCTVNLSGSWCAINLYLRSGVVLGDDKKTAYVPLIFRDKEGYSCLFWVGVRFNRDMISPGEWLNATAFDESPTTPGDGAFSAEKELRKVFRKAFLTERSLPRAVSSADREELQRSIQSLLGKTYSMAFEVVLPSAVAEPQEERIRAAALYPYFAVGSANGSSGKLRAVPDATQTASLLIPGKEKLLLRLYRHAQDEFSAMYVQHRESLLDYVIAHATEYSPVSGYLTVPVSVSSGGGSMIYTLYLRPVLKVYADDGLLPEDGSGGLHVDYPDEDLPL